MKKTNLKKIIKGAGLFLLGAIVTVIIPKISDKLSPNEPVVVKEIKDTVRVIHEYKLPNGIDSGFVQEELLKKLRNIKMLNEYEQQLKDYEKKITEHIKSVNQITNDSLLINTPNLILTGDKYKLLHKGYTQGQSTSYFDTQCPDLNKNEYINIRFKFFNDEIVQQIACLRVTIYKYRNDTLPYSMSFVMDEFYEPRIGINYIKLRNDLDKGKYEIQYGFQLTTEVENEYPTFYMKKCVLIKY